MFLQRMPHLGARVNEVETLNLSAAGTYAEVIVKTETMSAENFWSKIRSVRSVNLSSAYTGSGNAGSGSTRIPDDRQPPANVAPQSSWPQSDDAKVTSLIEALSLQPNHPPSQNSNSSNGSKNLNGSGAHAHSGHGTPSDIGMWRRPDRCLFYASACVISCKRRRRCNDHF
jgi:hypothetical protein